MLISSQLTTMENDFFFKKLCWVCLAEESNMFSLLNEDLKIHIDSTHSAVTLPDILSCIISTDVFFVGGPYLICNNCKLQACAAYKFKKRCEISMQIFKKCGLLPSTKQSYLVRTSPATKMEQAEIQLEAENSGESCDDYGDEATCDKKQTDKFQFSDTRLEKSFDNETIKTEPSTDEDALLNSIDVEESDVFLIVGDDKGATKSSCGDISCLEDPIAENSRLPRPGPRKFLCSICGLQKSLSSVRQHMLRHANVKDHVCPFCQKRFNDKGNLKVHVRIHTGVHPYTCDICGKKFIQATGLKTHKRMHDDIKPYKCHICTYSTRTSSHLQLHIKRHTGTKNYHCDQCDYSACSKAELKYHLAKHSDDKCHICKTCGKGFTRYKGLKTHEKSHTGEKPHICELCGRGFTQAHSLRSHLRNIHKKTD